MLSSKQDLFVGSPVEIHMLHQVHYRNINPFSWLTITISGFPPFSISKISGWIKLREMQYFWLFPKGLSDSIMVLECGVLGTLFKQTTKEMNLYDEHRNGTSHKWYSFRNARHIKCVQHIARCTEVRRFVVFSGGFISERFNFVIYPIFVKQFSKHNSEWGVSNNSVTLFSFHSMKELTLTQKNWHSTVLLSSRNVTRSWFHSN